MELLRQGYTLHFSLHPVLRMIRNEAGLLRAVLPRLGGGTDGAPEAVMRFEITRQTGAAELQQLRDGLRRVLSDVRAVVDDWAAMRERIAAIITSLEPRSLPVDPEDQQEVLHFLRWVNNHHFTFIGFRAYDLVNEQGQDVLRQVPGSGLGLLRDSSDDPARESQSFAQIRRRCGPWPACPPC